MRRILIVLVALFALNQTSTRGAESRFANSPTGSTTTTPQPLTLTVSATVPDRLCVFDSGHCAPMSAVRAFVTDYATEQQGVDLAAPRTTPNAIRAEVEIVHKERKPTPRIVVEVWLLDAGGNQIGAPIRDEHVGAVAASLLLTLNSPTRTKSEDQLVLEHMQNAAAHGGVAPIPAGSISGTAN